MTPDVEARLRAVAEQYDGDDGEAEALTRDTLARLQWRLRRGRKTCRACRRALPVASFGRDPSKGDGLRNACRACR